MVPRHMILAACLAAGLTAFGRAPVAQDDQEGTFQGVRYACAGISTESRNDPRWNGYSLKVAFADGTGGFLADVDVTVHDQSGNVVLEVLDCLAPWVLADLPPGKYEVTGVVLNQYRKRAVVTVSGGRQTHVVLRYPEITS